MSEDYPTIGKIAASSQILRKDGDETCPETKKEPSTEFPKAGGSAADVTKAAISTEGFFLNDDSALLDHLEKHPSNVPKYFKGYWSCVPFSNHERETFLTIRQAIRNAMKETK